jgi:hypothetical protein
VKTSNLTSKGLNFVTSDERSLRLITTGCLRLSFALQLSGVMHKSSLIELRLATARRDGENAAPRFEEDVPTERV